MDSWDLTEYEETRKPQEITMDSGMTISPKSLYREIICPICLDVLSQTRAAPDCMHRFCKSCIDKGTRKDCPVCHRKLPALLKSYREDTRFDQLISKIFSGYNKSLNGNSNNNCIGVGNTTNGNSNSSPSVRNKSNTPTAEANSNNHTNDMPREFSAPECEIVLRHLNGQQTRYLKCPDDSTVNHLTRYLAIRPEGTKMPNLNNDEEYNLCIVADRSKGHYELLAGTMRLSEVRNAYKLDSEKPLEFYYYNPGR